MGTSHPQRGREFWPQAAAPSQQGGCWIQKEQHALRAPTHTPQEWQGPCSQLRPAFLMPAVLSHADNNQSLWVLKESVALLNQMINCSF